MEIIQPRTEIEIKCVFGQLLSKIHEFEVITKTTTTNHRHQCAKKKSMTQLCEQLVRQTILFYMFHSVIWPSEVFGQPLNLPPERFTCGPPSLNVLCERRGYDTCIPDNKEFYCLPCSQEYLARLCGTQEEMTGCNLFCTERALDIETGKLTANFTEQLTYLHKQAKKSKKEASTQAKRINTLEGYNRNKDIALYAISVTLCITIVVLSCFLIWCYMTRQTRARAKAKLDVENPQQEPRTGPSEFTPLTKDDVSEGTSGISEETQLKELSVLPDSLDSIKVSDNEEQDITTPEGDKSEVSQKSKCQAIKELCNIPATNRKGHDKIAIKTNDHSHFDAHPQ